MRNPALPATLRPEPLVSKRNPRAEWTIEERNAWEQGMQDARAIAILQAERELAALIEQAIRKGPF